MDFDGDAGVAMRQSPKPHRDATRPIESHPQTVHKVQLLDIYYGQWAEILINSQYRPSELWIIEACAGAGSYASSESRLRYIRGCAIRACQRAKEIQRKYAHVDVHVVLIETNKSYRNSLSDLIREFTEANGRERVDVRIRPERFEDCAANILAATRRPSGDYHFSLWFVDPDGLTQIPYDTINMLSKVPRGPEVLINLTASGMQRVIAAATPLKYISQHAAAEGDARVMNRLFGDGSWRTVERGSRDIYLLRLVQAYASRFQSFGHRDVYKLNSNGDEVRFLIQLANTPRALSAFDATYQRTLRKGLYQGAGLTEQQRDSAAYDFFSILRDTHTTVDDVHKIANGKFDRRQVKTILAHAANIAGLGDFDPSLGMKWYAEPKRAAHPWVVQSGSPGIQMDLF